MSNTGFNPGPAGDELWQTVKERYDGDYLPWSWNDTLGEGYNLEVTRSEFEAELRQRLDNYDVTVSDSLISRVVDEAYSGTGTGRHLDPGSDYFQPEDYQQAVETLRGGLGTESSSSGPSGSSLGLIGVVAAVIGVVILWD